MFALTRKTDYALVALTGLACARGESISARDLSDRLSLPTPALRNILKTLANARLLRSTQGPFGGYELAKPAEQITIESVVEAIEGPIALARCCSDEHGGQAEHCRLEDSCMIKGAVRELHMRMRRFLRDTTIADLAGAAALAARSAPAIGPPVTTSRAAAPLSRAT